MNGISKTQLDGADISAYMTGQSSDAPHEELFWRTDRRVGQESGVLRVGHYKLMFEKKGAQLFDLKEDISESTDLSESETERMQSMLARWKELNQLSQPSYFTRQERGINAYQYADHEWLKGTPHYRPKMDIE